jgi:hypothetical protein
VTHRDKKAYPTASGDDDGSVACFRRGSCSVANQLNPKRRDRALRLRRGNGRRQGLYLFADLCNGWIREYDPETGETSLFATGLSPETGLQGVVDLEVRKSGELYYLKRGDTSSVHKIWYTGN